VQKRQKESSLGSVISVMIVSVFGVLKVVDFTYIINQIMRKEDNHEGESCSLS
jgi:hypothetical protein